MQELIALLKNRAQFNHYSSADVDSLIHNYYLNEPVAAQLLINAVYYLISDSLKHSLDSLINSKSKLTIDEIIKFLIRKSREKNEIRLNLLSANFSIS